MHRITPKTSRMQSASVLPSICCRDDWAILQSALLLQAHRAIAYTMVDCHNPVTSCTDPPSSHFKAMHNSLLVLCCGVHWPTHSTTLPYFPRNDSQGSLSHATSRLSHGGDVIHCRLQLTSRTAWDISTGDVRLNQACRGKMIGRLLRSRQIVGQACELLSCAKV